MQLRRVWDGAEAAVQLRAGRGWIDVREVLARLSAPPAKSDVERWSSDIVALLGAPSDLHAKVAAAATNHPAVAVAEAGATVLAPFEPRSFRDFMLYERHAVDAARGFVRTFMPHLLPFTRAYEAVTGRDFPKFRPAPLWHRQPIYYMGNHLAFVTDGAPVAYPSYTRALDYELELGFVLSAGLLNASPDEAEAAIGGFVVLNDLSARDVQREEMDSGFGPQKAKHFATAISSVVVGADEVLSRWRSLKGYVRINGQLVAEPVAANPRWSLGEVLAHASRSERLHPGELFGTGTFPGGSGIETGHLLSVGDTIEIGIEGVGALTNTIVAEEDIAIEGCRSVEAD
jgi:2-keto-4-pentenoate hydratase/2-oxohepta-3-ene-1,7-dioic acid hydratase in catechol pathway